ncbi:protein PATRONUS 2-like [Papaver somniferum]|uniref:protein PATRONUS 2-like n=1 Tax=Papaver somniferum TaxID=3469 RepID=UPI000E6F5D16|nr:protein PATRONUS 2-like [Papaver somniferum]XP_026409340.1 protein PATRONUS 2-like [Papaver somniferum]
MATRTLGVMQDENLHSHFRGPSRKALTNITNSSKLSPLKAASKKNLLKKSDNEQNGLYIKPGFINSNVKSNFKGDTVGGKSGLGGGVRKPLGDITNSRKLSLKQEVKNTNPKKRDDIAGERFLHDHQKCIKSQNCEMDSKLLLKTLGFDDDFSVQLSKPRIVPASLPPKVDSFSSLKSLEYDEIPELLYEFRSPPRCRTPEHYSTSPSMDRYAFSPTLMLLGSP